MPRKKAEPTIEYATRAVTVPLASGRVSKSADNILTPGRVSAIIAPPSADDTWRRMNLDARTLDKITPLQLAEYMIDISPEVSRGLFDFMRECNAGWKAEALRPGNEEVVDTEAQAALDADIQIITDLYGGMDVVIDKLFLSTWLRGAAFAEWVIDPTNGRDLADFVVIDGSSARFKLLPHPTRGEYHQLGQLQRGQWVPLERPTIRYVPIDPLPGKPYGRPLISPALFTALFLLGLLHDLRRVIAQQGYPRLDIEIDLEMLAKRMPTNIIPGSQKEQEWVEAVVDQVATYYQNLEPDMAFTHSSLVKINRPVGTVGIEHIGGLEKIFEAVERMAVRALKTTPFMMALSESTTESQANRQYEIHAIGTRSGQHKVETILEALFGVGLRAKGIIAKVRWRFAENRVSEEMRDAQVLQLKIANAGEAYRLGYWSQDEGARYAVGKEKADAPEPRDTQEPEPVDNASKENPDPGSSRKLDLVR